jgi:predicted nucleic acid-binding protein
VILVDTSVWVDHLRRGNARLATLLDDAQVLCHPLVLGELALGNLRARHIMLDLLAALPVPPLADHEEVLRFIEVRRLYGRGIGWVDVQLLASCLLARCALWTLDERLGQVAAQLRVAV